MLNDLTVAVSDKAVLNVRVGAIIMKQGKFLMVGNDRAEYLYSVGGRIQVGETAEEAVKREVYEETGVELAIDRLGFIHENYFIGDSGKSLGKWVYEISFFFYMNIPDDFRPVCDSFAEGIVSIEERMLDVKKRYGYYPQEKWERNIELKEYFENKARMSLEQIFE